MEARISVFQLRCPLCNSSSLASTDVPCHTRNYFTTLDIHGQKEAVTDRIGESRDVDCKNCGFEFTYRTEQEA